MKLCATVLGVALLFPAIASAQATPPIETQLAQLQTAIQQLQQHIMIARDTVAVHQGICPPLTKPLSLGMRDANTNGQVSALQAWLAQYYGLGSSFPSGYFGKQTLQYVKRFQKSQGLTASGLVGPQTRAAIARVCTASSSSSASGNASTALSSQQPAPRPVPQVSVPITGATYVNPEIVTVQGYNGSQEDPVISPDGQYLFFDSWNDAGKPSHLFYAKRIDYKTFQLIGEVQGVNYSDAATVRGNFDNAGDFYFVSGKFQSQSGPSVGQGIFSNGSVSGIGRIRGLPQSATAGYINTTFDVDITPDGNTLYYTEAQMDGSKPYASKIAIASKNASGSFTKLANSDYLLSSINATSRLVYNGIESNDGLALFFTGVSGVRPVMYVSTRTSTADPFGTPMEITAANSGIPGDFSENGTLSPDGTYLYFHRVTGSSSSQLYVLTRQ